MPDVDDVVQPVQSLTLMKYSIKVTKVTLRSGEVYVPRVYLHV